jgi:hypothetical protein
MLTNYEVGVILEGEPASQVAQLIDELVNLSRL